MPRTLANVLEIPPRIVQRMDWIVLDETSRNTVSEAVDHAIMYDLYKQHTGKIDFLDKECGSRMWIAKPEKYEAILNGFDFDQMFEKMYHGLEAAVMAKCKNSKRLAHIKENVPQDGLRQAIWSVMDFNADTPGQPLVGYEGHSMEELAVFLTTMVIDKLYAEYSGASDSE